MLTNKYVKQIFYESRDKHLSYYSNAMFSIVSGMAYFLLIGFILVLTISPLLALNKTQPRSFSVIHQYHYKTVQARTNRDINTWLTDLNHIGPIHKQLNEKVILLSHLLANKPYLFVGAMGEGLNCDYYHSKKVCHHIQEDPMVRTDGFNCVTLVQTVLALLSAGSPQAFARHIQRIAYGGAMTGTDKIAYYNRNHFMSMQFNRINQQHHYIKNVTTQGVLKSMAKHISTQIDMRRWFLMQQKAKRIHSVVRVQDKKNGAAMVKRFLSDYPPVYPIFKKQVVTLSYLPKTELEHCQNQHCKVNQAILGQLPTPAIAEIVRNDAKWKIAGKPIKALIGSGILISHLGILYRENFHDNQVIYQHIHCLMVQGKKVCQVMPVRCHHKTCHELMFMHASDAFPNGYYYYQKQDKYYCTKAKPTVKQVVSRCNRVRSIPFVDYLRENQYGRYIYMNNKSLLGIHVEQIL